jgi:hypothetical protein
MLALLRFEKAMAVVQKATSASVEKSIDDTIGNSDVLCPTE